MKLSKDFMVKKISDEYMLIPIGNDKISLNSIYNINETGYFIYQLLEKELNIEEITNKMIEEYDCPYEIALKDVKEFIEFLMNKGIIHEN